MFGTSGCPKRTSLQIRHRSSDGKLANRRCTDAVPSVSMLVDGHGRRSSVIVVVATEGQAYRWKHTQVVVS